MKVYALLFESDDVCVVRAGNVEGGILDLGDMAFDVTGQKALMIKKGFGYYPFYILRFDSVKPSFLNPKFEPDDKIDPKNFKRLISLRIIGNLIKLEKRTLGAIPIVLISIFLGLMIGYVLFKIVMK